MSDVFFFVFVFVFSFLFFLSFLHKLETRVH